MYYFLLLCYYRINFRFQPTVCNGSHDMAQKSMSFNNVAVVTIEGNNYSIQSWFMTKSDPAVGMKSVDLIGKYIMVISWL